MQHTQKYIKQLSFFLSLVCLLVSDIPSATAQTTVTLNATADHSGLVENNANNPGQFNRADTLWGNDNSPNKQRNGLVEFELLPLEVRAGLATGTLELQEVKLQLWNSSNAWDPTTLNFLRLNDADTDWTGGRADDGQGGIATWNDKGGPGGADWSGGVSGGGIRGQIFGELTSTNPSGTTLGDTLFETIFSGSELTAWLGSESIAPNLLVEEKVPGDGKQTRFATINSADTDDEFAPNLVVTYGPSTGPVFGDTDGDGTVELSDLDMIRENFGLSIAARDQGDIFDDDVIDDKDYRQWKTAWDTLQAFTALGAFSVPEPTSLLLGSLGLCCLGLHRRRC